MNTPLDKYKTYIIIAIAIAATIYFYTEGAITGEAAFMAILGFLGLGTTKHALNRIERKR